MNRGLLVAAQEVAPAGVTVELVEIADIPPYNQDLQDAEGDPPGVRHLKARIVACQAILIATPEFNFGVPGFLKNALDWASRPEPSPLERRAVGIISASPGMPGGVRGQLQLRQNLLYTNSYVLPQPQFAVGQARAKFDPDGRLTDERTQRKLTDYLVTLLAWSRIVEQVGAWPGTEPTDRHVF
jgi:chromate reductase, NAD(P)H dehydrogenase (quinone)